MVQLAEALRANPALSQGAETRNLLMSSPVDSVVTEADGEDSARGGADAQPLAMRTCSRLGRVANPPGFSIADWFRPSRRR